MGGGTPYQRLLQGMYDATLIADLQGRIVDVNVRAVEYLIYPKKELCQRSVFDIIWGAERSLIETLCKNLENQRHTLIQAYCKRQDETFFPAEIAVTKLELDHVHLGFFVRDITVRRRAEEMLLTEHCAIQNSGSGIAITDLAGIVEFANPSCARMWACTREGGLAGMAIADLLADRDMADAMLARLASPDAAEWSGSAEAVRADGSRFLVQISAARNRNSEGETVGFVLSFVDMSDRKRAEEAERKAERQRVMLESLGAACHHLGQPATVLLANLELLKKQLAGADHAAGHLLDGSLAAIEQISEILKRLTAVNEYKTMAYLPAAEGEGGGESRIIAI